MTWRHSKAMALAMMVGGAGLLAGCARVDQAQDFGAMQAMVRARTGAAPAPDGTTDEATAARVTALLAAPLGPQDAVRIALLQNRGLRADYAGIGLAEADLLAAELPENPQLDGAVRFPDRLYGITDVGFALTEGVASLILRPAHERIGKAEIAAARLRVVAAAVRLVARTETAYFRLCAAEAAAKLARARARDASAAAMLAARMRAAGTMNALEAARLAARAAARASAQTTAETAVAEARAALGGLTGLSEAQMAGLRVPDRLPEVPPVAVPTGDLAGLAIRGNVDLAALRAEAVTAAKRLGVRRDYGWLTDAQLGVGREQNPEHYTVTGPVFQIPLPLFDHGQAARLRAAVRLRRDENTMRQTALDLRARVAALRARLAAAAAIARRYREHEVPLRQAAVAQAVRQYNFMLLGDFGLLAQQDAALEARAGLVTATRDYWLARAALDEALGGGQAVAAMHGEKAA